MSFDAQCFIPHENANSTMQEQLPLAIFWRGGGQFLLFQKLERF